MASQNNDISALTTASPDSEALSVASSMLDLAKVGDDYQPTLIPLLGVNSEVIQSDSLNSIRSGDLNNPLVHSMLGKESSDSKNKFLPRRLSITYPNSDICQPNVETEVCHIGNSDCAQVSVIKAELNIGSDGAEEENYLLVDQIDTSDAGNDNIRVPEVMERNSQDNFPIPLPLDPPTLTDIVAINPKYIPSTPKVILLEPVQTIKSPRGRKPPNGSKLNKVVSKLILAKSNTNESESNPSILHNLLLNSPLDDSGSADNQCLQTTSDVLKHSKKTASKLLPPVVPETLRLPSELVIIPRPTSMTINQSCIRDTPNICDNLPKITNCSIPSPVVNRLRKLGTVVEVEGTSSTKNSNGKSDMASRLTELFDSMAQADNILSDLTKKKKKKTTKKVQENNHKVPSEVLTQTTELGATEKFSFQVDKTQVMELPEGQKLFTCDICSGVYYRGFSLKRHYLKTHINSKHISARDLHNCGIIIDKSAVENGARGRPRIDSPPIVSNLSQPKIIIPDLYRCYNCAACFPDKNELKVHLMDHPPVSLQTINEKQFAKTYRCANCLLHFQKKKQYLRHLESCAQELQKLTYHCLYCEKSFPSFEFKKKHQWKMHHPKKRLHPCYICKMKMFKFRTGLFKHLLAFHTDEYFGCLLCNLRFIDRSELKKHKKEKHGKEKKRDSQTKIVSKTTKTDDKADHTVTNENFSKDVFNYKCTCCSKTFNEYVNMCRHRRLAHNIPPKKNKKDNKTDLSLEKISEPVSSNIPLSLPPSKPRIIDPETFFYSRISLNIRENLLHHLDGKLDSQEVMEYDLKPSSSTQINRNKLLNFSASFTSAKGSLEKQISITPTKEDVRPSHSIISPKVPWEKFNFPKNYDGRCGLTSYIKDMSHLDIATQLTMRRNLQRFNCSLGQEINKDNVNEDIPSGLSLERQGAACAETYGDPETSVVKDSEGMPELSGEWTRPRTYICAACGLKSGSLWEIEDHKASLHPNVWCPHVEVVGEQSSVWDWVYYRSLPSQSALGVTSLPTVNKSSLPKCTKCLWQCASTPDLHRHMLECGGDTTWMSTMLAVTSPGSRRSRKWRPFGSRRRRQQGRRGMKRNIPNTPAKHLCGKIRTKPGDTDTIQKMIANLPPKRVTRKVIDEIDIKTRSQATINSVPFNVFTYTNKPPSSLNGKTNKPGRPLQKTTTGLGKKSKSNETSENKKEDPNGKKSTKTESSSCSFTSEDHGTDFVKLEDVPIRNIEAEVMVQHSDILTSLQMIPVVRKEVLEELKESEEPIETEMVLAAMREAMDASADVPAEKVFKKKSKDKRKKEDADVDLIICNGCGMQFDSSSACQRHKKKCVYWKQENSIDEFSTNKCAHCNTVFPYLMALLTHSCKIAKVCDDPSMPELSRVEPVEELKLEAVEDIPILSPEDIKKTNSIKKQKKEERAKRLAFLETTIDEVAVEDIPILSPEDIKKTNSIKKQKKEERAKRLVLLETTIEEVANECFIIEQFHLKSKIDFVKTEDVGVDKVVIENLMKLEMNQHDVINKNSVKEIKSSPVKLEQNETAKKKSKLGDSHKKVSDAKLSSPKEDSSINVNIKQNQKNGLKTIRKNKKYSSVEVEKRMKGKIVKFKGGKKSFKSKLVLRTVIPNKGINKNKVLKRKLKVIVRKRRSTNLDMLLKESEKLGEDGALIFGKRRRQDSVNSVDLKMIDKIKIEEKIENGEVIKKKPGRPKKIKVLTNTLSDKIEVKNEETSTIDSNNALSKKIIEEIVPVTTVKPKFKLSSLDRKTGKVVKYNGDNMMDESKMRQTNLDGLFEKSPTSNNEALSKDKTKNTNLETEKKQIGRPKMKQTTLDLMREKSPTSKNENQNEKSKLIPPKPNKTENKAKTISMKNTDTKDNNQLEVSSQTKVNVIAGDCNSKVLSTNKIEPKTKNRGKNCKASDSVSVKVNEEFIEDPDEIPLSRVKIEPKEINEGIQKFKESDKKYSNAKESRNTFAIKSIGKKTRMSPIKNGLKSQQRCKDSKNDTLTVGMSENYSKHPDKEIKEENENNTEENRSSINEVVSKSINVRTNSNVCKDKKQKCKISVDDKTSTPETGEQVIDHEVKKISDNMEWETIDSVVANYSSMEETTDICLEPKKKPRGRPPGALNFSKVKSKNVSGNLDKNTVKPVKPSKKKRSTDESERETIEMVVNAANNDDDISFDIKSETDPVVDDDCGENVIKGADKINEKEGIFLRIIETSSDDKDSVVEDNIDVDEDESLINLKRKLQSAKEESLKKDELIQKKSSMEKNKVNSNDKLDLDYSPTTVCENINQLKVKKKFNHVNTKQPKNFKKSKKPNFSPDDGVSSVKMLGVKEKIKKKKKIKLKQILKNGNFDMTEVTVKRVAKRNMSQNEQVGKKLSKFNDKLFKKLKKKHKFGVAGSKWQVSLVNSSKSSISTNVIVNAQEKKKDDLVNTNSQYYCNTCDEYFVASYSLYEHQLTASHKKKQTTLTEQPKGIEICCNTLANVLNDLEKKTLQVAKVMNQLKHRESTESVTDDLRTVNTSNLSDVPNLTIIQSSVLKKEHSESGSGTVEVWASQSNQNQDWVSQDWSMIRPTTPLWENQQQPWENESNFSSGGGSSLGSILDSVNKILTEQEVSTQPLGLPQYTMADLQKAMGASDEEMAMLEQLGEGSLQEDYVYDNTRPGADIWPKEDVPTFMDLDNQEPNVIATTSSSQDAIVPVEPRSVVPSNETESDIRQCRGLLGRPRRLLNDYEMREMVCPTCNKHFLGLSALQTHVAWSHCAPVHSSARTGGGLKRRALLNGCEEIDRRLVCFVCKEIVSSSNQLDIHIQAQHMKKNSDSEQGSPNKEEGAEKLKNKMSNALGGLLDRALNNLLGAKQKTTELINAQPELNSGALQLLGKLCAVRRRVGNENMKLSGETLQLLGRLRAAKCREDANTMKIIPSFAKELRQVINRATNKANNITGVNKANLSASVSSEIPAFPDVKPTNLLDHLAVCSNDVEQRPYACPICDVRFLIPSIRNRHIARAHGKYGRKYNDEVQEQIAEQLAMDACGNSTEDIGESDWRDFFPMLDEHFDGETEINPLCSDCGLSFRSIHEVIRHRKEDHPKRFLSEAYAEENSIVCKQEPCNIANTKIEDVTQPSSSSSILPVSFNAPMNTLPVSDSAIDSTSSLKKRGRGRPPKMENVTQNHGANKEDIIQIENTVLGKKTARRRINMEDNDEEDLSDEQEIQSNEVREESDTNSRSTVDDKQDETLNNGEEELDFLFGKSDAEFDSTSKKKEENLAILRRMDKRKCRLSYLGEEAVRVKAEAALKELNQPRKNKSTVATARWGVNALRFVKNNDPNNPNNYQTPCFSPSKVRFASLSEKKYKGSSSDGGTPIKIEKMDTVSELDEKPDIYDFNDDDFLIDKKPFSPLKDLQDLDKTKCVLTDEGIQAAVSEKCKLKLNDS